MTNAIKLIIYLFIMTTAAKAFNPARQTSLLNFALWRAAHISPEILNELKDFENLIPATTIDEIVAKHFLIDGNFRTAFKYLRSEEFTQLQRQVLNLPEVLDILEFLHLTTVNATMRHMGKTTTELIATEAIKATTSYEHNDDNAMTIVSTVNSAHNLNSIERTKGTFNNKKTVNKRPQKSMQLNSIDDDDIASSFNVEQQPLVRIVLLKDSVVTNSNSYDVANDNKDHQFNNHQQHSCKYRQRFSNNYHHHHDDEHYQSLGTFTAFVEEVLQHLPHDAYQNMIKDKCHKNAKFAEFYQALRSQEFKLLVQQSMQTSNIKNVIKTLSAHDVDVLALKPIAFQVIAWGPNI